MDANTPSTPRLDQGDDFVTPVTLRPGEGEQLVDVRHHRATLRRTDHAHPTAPREVEQSFVAKNVQCSNHSVLIHPEYRR